ncbi:MAG: hypothetical protein LBP62_08430 [Clostridiales bacterium]|jgi:hypothetical protein|nr:hypothetical protein [Clostridiales bacterium]
MRKRKIALLCVLVLLITGVAGVLSGCEPKSIDEIWMARLYESTSSPTGQAVCIYGVMPKYRGSEELILPEKIDGHPVKKLFANKPYFSDASSGQAPLGNLRRLTIEASVQIIGHFFDGSKVFLIEFTNLNPSVFNPERGIWFPITVIPDGSSADYLSNCNPYRKSEVINGFLIKNGVFGGYIGNDTEIEIPDNATSIMNGEYYFKLLIATCITSVKFPPTIKLIQKDSIFYDFSRGNPINELNGLKTVYVSKSTTIETDAFSPAIEIIYY